MLLAWQELNCLLKQKLELEQSLLLALEQQKSKDAQEQLQRSTVAQLLEIELELVKALVEFELGQLQVAAVENGQHLNSQSLRL